MSSDTNILEAIGKALERAKRDSEMSEEDTCDRIIVPLLNSLDYEPSDWNRNPVQADRKKPDFILLPKAECKFFLEVQRWQEPFDILHVHKIVEYPSKEGKQWGVLTNGFAWRLYDAHLKDKPHEQKLVFEMHLDDKEEAMDFLRAIGKNSVQEGGLKDYGDRKWTERLLVERRDRLRRTLAEARPESDLVKAVLGVIKREPRHQDTSPEDIVGIFEALSPASTAITNSAVPRRDTGREIPTMGKAHPESPFVSEASEVIDTIIAWVNEKGRMEWRRKRNKFYTGLQCDKRKKGCAFVHFEGREDSVTLSAEVSQKSEWVMKLKGQGLDADVKEDRFVRVKGLTADSLRKHREVLRGLVGEAVTEYEARKPEFDPLYVPPPAKPPRLNAPESWRNRSPRSFTFRGQEEPVSTFREVLLKLLGRLAKEDRERLERFCDQSRYVSRDPHGLRYPRPVPGAEQIHVETNLSANAIRDLCLKALRSFGLSPSEFEVRLEAN